MDLYEWEGKKLLAARGIEIPRAVFVHEGSHVFDVFPSLGDGSVVVKAQVRAGGRGRAGGVRFARGGAEMHAAISALLGWEHGGERVDAVLVEERVDAEAEYYASASYDTVTRGPVLVFSVHGGVDVAEAIVLPFDPDAGVGDDTITQLLVREAVPLAHRAALADVLRALVRCFLTEQALLVEVNPLFITRDGRAVAGDAKVVLDDDVVRPSERRFLSLGGDIAVLASGGGASLLNIDALMSHGGRPANYIEYSGNPPADVVRDLTVRVLSQSNIRGCWVVGGTANFTDIAVTMEGFVAGLRLVQPKPTYPIVVRRDGPRQREAFAMLAEVSWREGYQLYTFGSETPMEESARLMVKLAYGDPR
jgi:succinyl-CoA synthetase beta subunit